MKHDVAGDPLTGLKWTRRTTDKIADQLRCLGIDVRPRTVARLLKKMEYSLRVNRKKLSRGSQAGREEQFAYIAEMRERFAARGWPIISVDTKKKEMVGCFKNAGSVWAREAIPVNDHDFRSDALGMAIPYGIYDVQANRGTLFIGMSHDTPEFAADSLGQWWRSEGRRRHPHAQQLLVLADGGGSNGPRCRAWLRGLQNRVCDPHRLRVTVCHYPTGASKWNPIEHRLFSEISKNWAGRPLDSYETVLRYAQSTRTKTGLRVRAHLVRRSYPTGVKISKEQMVHVRVRRHEIQPDRNYTVSPR